MPNDKKQPEEQEIEINEHQAAELLAKALKLGATGQHPEGKVSPDDEGELKLGVAHKDGNVVIVFGRPVAWLAMPPLLIRSFTRVLNEHADKVEREALIKEGEARIEE